MLTNTFPSGKVIFFIPASGRLCRQGGSMTLLPVHTVHAEHYLLRNAQWDYWYYRGRLFKWASATLCEAYPRVLKPWRYFHSMQLLDNSIWSITEVSDMNILWVNGKYTKTFTRSSLQYKNHTLLSTNTYVLMGSVWNYSLYINLPMQSTCVGLLVHTKVSTTGIYGIYKELPNQLHWVLYE